MSLDLDAIKARCDDDLTIGPWRAGQAGRGPDGRWHLPIVYDLPVAEDETVEDQVAVISYDPGAFHFPHGQAKADAEFIAHARTDVPKLLDALAAASKRIGELEAELVGAA